MWLPSISWVCTPLSLAVGFLWPSYASFKALEGRSAEPAAVWLTYWVVVSLGTVLGAALGPLLQSWTALYAPLQLAALLWLALPQTQGASIFYSQVLLPLLTKHEADIDRVLDAGSKRTEELVNPPVHISSRSPVFTVGSIVCQRPDGVRIRDAQNPHYAQNPSTDPSSCTALVCGHMSTLPVNPALMFPVATFSR